LRSLQEIQPDFVEEAKAVEPRKEEEEEEEEEEEVKINGRLEKTAYWGAT
jgi:hypothetical protein